MQWKHVISLTVVRLRSAQDATVACLHARHVVLQQHAEHTAGQINQITHSTAQSDSIEGIYDTLKECACISKSAGGIGLSIHNIRAVGSYIRGTNGNSNGIVPMLRVFNDTARCSPKSHIHSQRRTQDAASGREACPVAAAQGSTRWCFVPPLLCTGNAPW